MPINPGTLNLYPHGNGTLGSWVVLLLQAAAGSIHDRVANWNNWTLPPAHGGNTFFVSLSGSDANSGSDVNPFATPEFAAQQANPGDRIVFKNGVYDLTQRGRWWIKTQGLPGAPITYTCENLHGAKIYRDPVNSAQACVLIGQYDPPTDDFLLNTPFHLIFDGMEFEGGGDHCFENAGGANVTLRNSKVHESYTQEGVKWHKRADNGLIENNEIYHIGISPAAVNADGIDITHSWDVTARLNHIHHVTQWCCYTKKSSKRTLIAQNIMHDSAYGISLGESTITYAATAKNNYLYNIDGTGIEVGGAKDSFILNNTCYRVARTQRAGLRWARCGDGLSGDEDPGDGRSIRNLTIKNNIVVVDSNRGDIVLCTTPNPFEGIDRAAMLQNLDCDYNLYWNLQNVPANFQFDGGDRGNLAAWQAWTAGLGAPQDAHSMYVDPAFLSTDALSPDFLRLAIGSVAANAGVPVAQLAKDFFDLLRGQGAGWSIGAEERY